MQPCFEYKKAQTHATAAAATGILNYFCAGARQYIRPLLFGSKWQCQWSRLGPQARARRHYVGSEPESAESTVTRTRTTGTFKLTPFHCCELVRSCIFTRDFSTFMRVIYTAVIN